MITLEDLKNCRLRNVGHFHGSGIFGDLHQCIEHPRLRRHTTYTKKNRGIVVAWAARGVASLDSKAKKAGFKPLDDSYEFGIHGGATGPVTFWLQKRYGERVGAQAVRL